MSTYFMQSEKLADGWETTVFVRQMLVNFTTQHGQPVHVTKRQATQQIAEAHARYWLAQHRELKQQALREMAIGA